jgi:polyhydroxyalkanoate synthase
VKDDLPKTVAALAPEELGSALSLSAERLKVLRENAETLADPFGMIAPLAHAHVAWMLHPMELAELATRFSGDLLTLQLHTAAKLAGRDAPDVVRPQADDRRFADPVWSAEPGWDLLKQWYLFVTRHVQDALFQTPGLSPRERRRAAFWWRKWLNAVAPTNFLLTNPVAMRKAIESGGESLRRGFDLFLDDLRAGTVRMTDPEDFSVGVNLATTPGAVVFRNRLLELIHYAPSAPQVRPTPIVIVTPWINKFYVLDLEPRKSMVKYLLDRGFDVYITSWKNPGQELADTGFEDYLTQGIDQAVRVARAVSRADKVHAAGYCIGGTLLSTYMAWLNRRHARPEDVPVAHWTLLATLTDFQSPGDIEVFLDEGSVRWLADMMRTRGYLDGREMAATFRLLRSNSLIWHYVVHGWLYGERLAPHDVLYWNMDTTRMPYRMHEYYLREMYLKNNLVKPNALVVAGEPIDLVRIVQPLYQVATEDDHIAPWRQSWRIHSHLPGRKRFVLSSSGHILGIVNPPVTPARRSYRVAPAHRGQAADDWRATAEPKSGSWWEDWSEWLAERCGEPGAPPALASAEFPRLAEAPGTYVLER